MKDRRRRLHARAKGLPDEPGVYLLHDARGRVIYVGKAASLKNRVRSYFQSPKALDPKTRALVEEVADFEVIVTANEHEALLLEDALIKRHRPRYNVRLRDDKRYPYLKLTADPFPRLVLTRRVEADVKRGARYFGPYTNTRAMRETRRILQKLFRIRTCSLKIPPDGKPVRKRPCLDYHLGLCDAPCVGAVRPGEYRRLVDEATLFLQGRNRELLPQLRREMEEASQRLEFERAARIRDRLQALERLQHSRGEGAGDQDALGIAVCGDRGIVEILQVRDGVWVGRERVSLTLPPDSAPEEALLAFLKQRYGTGASVPKEILLPLEMEGVEKGLLESWLSARRGSRVYLKTPKRGPKARFVRTATRNAQLALEEELRRRRLHREPQVDPEPLRELRRIFGLSEIPRRIEGFDVSNLRGREPVASMVVFTDGGPDKGAYRRFGIRGLERPDDVGMLAEAVRRRLERALEGDDKFLPLPDLLLLDGGKGQLNAVLSVLSELGVEIPVGALAKEEELLYLPGCSRALRLPSSSPALQLLQRVRDEAHRFALAGHRARRTRRGLQSLLDEIPGIGPRRKRRLMHRFGSLKRLREASLEELRQAGLPRSVAERLYRALRGVAAPPPKA